MGVADRAPGRTSEGMGHHERHTSSKSTSTETINEPKFAASGATQDVLGFSADDVRLHSVHGSLAMLMYLAKEPVYTIRLVGR